MWHFFEKVWSFFRADYRPQNGPGGNPGSTMVYIAFLYVELKTKFDRIYHSTILKIVRLMVTGESGHFLIVLLGQFGF